ncbi:MAG: hypothetical protein ACTSY1_10590 [Alphaproteobacteria bacterium]
MIVFRILGYLLALAGFGFLIVDGSRSIAAGALELTPLGETWFKIDPPSLNLVQAVVERYTHPLIWDPLIVTVLQWPTFAVGLGLGLVFILIGRRRRSH